MIPFSTRYAILCLTMMAAARFATAADAPPSPPPTERELIALLQSGAQPAEKAIACKRLAVCGSKEATSALAPLLLDPQLASWARIALEAIPDPAADQVLRSTLGKLEGRLLVGVINSLGVRRDANSAEPLAQKLASPDPEVASAAAVALGHIGGPAAVKALESSLASAPPLVRSAVAEGCILLAERALSESQSGEATRLYDAVRSANVNPQRNLEATRGAILARGAAGVPMLAEQLRSPDRALFRIGLRTARELPGAAVAQALVEELARAQTPEQKASLLLALADRRDAQALPCALEAAKSGPTPLRLVAIGVLDRIGDVSCVAPLLAIAAEDDPALSTSARLALTRLPGAEVDSAIVATLKQPGEKARLLGIELAAQRRLTSLIPDLLRMAEEPNAALSAASLKALGEMGSDAELQPLIAILLQAKSTAGVESALAAIGARMSQPATGSVQILKAVYGDLPDGPSADVTAKVAELVKTSTSVKATNAAFGDPAGGRVKKLRVDFTIQGEPGSQTVAENGTVTFAVSSASPAFVDAICGPMAQASAEAKPALLRVLGSVGGTKALATVRTALQSSDPALREAAFTTLCQWPGPEALPDLKGLVQNGSDLKQKVLAMRGYVRLVAQVDFSIDKKLEALQDAMSFAPRDEERKLVLGALGGIRSPQALKLILPNLDNPALKEEACVAAVSVADNFRRVVPASVAAAMEKVAQATSNPGLAKRAQALATRTEAGKK